MDWQHGLYGVVCPDEETPGGRRADRNNVWDNTKIGTGTESEVCRSVSAEEEATERSCGHDIQGVRVTMAWGWMRDLCGNLLIITKITSHEPSIKEDRRRYNPDWKYHTAGNHTSRYLEPIVQPSQVLEPEDVFPPDVCASLVQADRWDIPAILVEHGYKEITAPRVALPKHDSRNPTRHNGVRRFQRPGDPVIHVRDGLRNRRDRRTKMLDQTKKWGKKWRKRRARPELEMESNEEDEEDEEDEEEYDMCSENFEEQYDAVHDSPLPDKEYNNLLEYIEPAIMDVEWERVDDPDLEEWIHVEYKL